MDVTRLALGLGGVTMAVAVTMTSVAINEGAAREARREVERLGSDTIVLRGHGLSLEDADWIARIGPRRATVSGVVRANNGTRDVLAVGPGYGAIRPIAIGAGRFLSASDERDGARVCVLGSTIARDVFGREDAIGQRIRLGRDWFVVVGVMESGAPADAEIFVPFSAWTARTAAAEPRQPVSEIWIGAGAGNVAAIERAIRAAIADRPRMQGSELVVARDLLHARDRTQRMFTRLTALMGVLLFALGGLAIANVMLTSVLERRAEIGVRRATGATRRRILYQFIRESLALTAAGSLAGVAAGFALAAATARLAGWPAVFPATLAAVPAGAIAVGMAAGLYPAMVAARMTPIDALMHD